MKSQTTTTSQPLTVTVLAALWVSLGRCGVPEIRGPLLCDNGKLSLEGDLPAEGAFWYCPGFMRPEFTQRRPSIDTVYDPVPATQICMDRSIFYNHTIPNSGAYRPVRAERGEYLYCPPQRWLNNLHHGATVLLYHPCAPLHDRLLLSELARSCLPDYVITSHLQLSKHMPLALVSWGHTLELSTISSSDICGWLETTASTRNKLIGVSQSEKYNLLLTWSAEQQDGQPEGHSHLEIKESLRQCCEQTISSLLNGAMETELEPNMKNEIWRKEEEEGSGAAVMNKGFPSTPRTDEAMWAAAALGFLLILLAVSVLHTRLYRHWRTMPSLYWHNPQQDYDSVADVIRRRLRISNKRRKRGRRQECALLPSSSSSDEDP
ncbi:uncharacterized protein tp53i13 isoform X2 [Sebastes fasciatus]|uniref:uncharacterized protein tp53i13 isoform X2 n=1 Tax=Sebastes fasciatus TaxID=394691 RepID=UPI003D9F0A9B